MPEITKRRPGRPNAENPLISSVRVYLTDDEMAELESAVRAMGGSKSDWVRVAILMRLEGTR